MSESFQSPLRLPRLFPGAPALSTAAALAGVLLLAGCASFGESAERDTLTAQVGVYPPPPPGVGRARLGVPAFLITGDGKSLEGFAADQLTTLAFQTGRFDVIERAQLQQLLDEQNLEGIVVGGELAKPGLVRGVDYLLLGKVTNLRVKKEKATRGFALGSVPVPGAGVLSGTGFEKGDMNITAECGVDLRLVDPTTGALAASHFSEFKRTDSASALAVSVLGVTSDAEAEVELDDDNKGKILRLALDDTVRKMLPQIDQVLLARARAGGVEAASSAGPPGTTAAPSAGGGAPAEAPAQPAAGPKFCSSCGGKLAADAKFCGGCGAKVGP